MPDLFSHVRQVVPVASGSGHDNQSVLVSSTDGVLVRWRTGNSAQGDYRILDSDGDIIGESGPTFPGYFYFSTTLLADGDVVLQNVNRKLLRFDSDGQLTDESAASVGSGTPGRVAELSSGNLIATFGSGTEVRGQFLSPTLDPIGSSFLLVSGLTYQAEVKPLSGGGFVVYGISASQGAWVIQAFDANGAAVGPQILDTRISGVDVEALPDGGYAAAFGSLDLPGLVGQVFNADGTARTAEFPLHTPVGTPHVVILDDSLFAIVVNFRDGPVAQLVHVSGRPIGSPELLEAGALDAAGIDADSFVTVTAISGNNTAADYYDFNTDALRLGTAAGEELNGIGAERLLVGLGGDDVYVVDSAGDEVDEIAGEGTDRIRTSISFTIAAGESIEILQTDNNIGTAALALTGNALSQFIFGNSGANLIDGGGGGDIMLGLAGDDLYIVRNSADQVRESAGEGLDRINGTTSYSLGAGQEVEVLATTNNLGTQALNITGNELRQHLFGNAGANVLTGGGGGDVMIGFGGNDTYVVTDGGDDVREAAGEGAADRVNASVSFALRADQSIEFLFASDPSSTAALNLTGNALAQEIVGNAGANVLTGGGGADLLRGLAGDDTYVITPDAVVQDFAGQGFDRLFVSGSYTLAGSEIEAMTPLNEFGTEAFNLTGNGFAQFVYGNDGANRLDGGGGGDILIGRGGDDLLFVRNSADQIREEANDGSDRALASTSWRLNAGAQVEVVSTTDNLGTQAINLTGNEFAQFVYGNAGTNTIGGGAGRDVLNGLGGSDFFLFDTALNTGFAPSFGALAPTANVDRIDGFAADDRIALSGALFGLTPGALPAGAFNTGTTATEADDRILWDAASGALLFDPDGSGGQAAQLFAFLSSPFSLDSTFIVVV